MRLLRDILLAVLVALLISIAGVVGSIGTLPKRGRRGSRDGRSSAGLPEHALNSTPAPVPSMSSAWFSQAEGRREVASYRGCRIRLKVGYDGSVGRTYATYTSRCKLKVIGASKAQ
jgi:hypothetical protein